jgi:hypothetical protein
MTDNTYFPKKNPVTLEIRPKRRFFRDGWQYRVATYGETHNGNGVVGWCRTEGRAITLGRRYQKEIEKEVAQRLLQSSDWTKVD